MISTHRCPMSSSHVTAHPFRQAAWMALYGPRRSAWLRSAFPGRAAQLLRLKARWSRWHAYRPAALWCFSSQRCSYRKTPLVPAIGCHLREKRRPAFCSLVDPVETCPVEHAAMVVPSFFPYTDFSRHTMGPKQIAWQRDNPSICGANLPNRPPITVARIHYIPAPGSAAV